MQLTEGKKYIDRKGRVWGPVVAVTGLEKDSAWAWRENGWVYRLTMEEGSNTITAGFKEDGRHNSYATEYDLIAEA